MQTNLCCKSILGYIIFPQSIVNLPDTHRKNYFSILQHLMIVNGSKAMDMVSRPHPIYILEFGLDFQGFLRGHDEKDKKNLDLYPCLGQIDNLQTRAGYRFQKELRFCSQELFFYPQQRLELTVPRVLCAQSLMPLRYCVCPIVQHCLISLAFY